MDHLEDLKTILKQYIDFLEPFKPLLDTQNVKFTSENHWEDETILSSSLRNELNQFIDECNSFNQPINLVKNYQKYMTSNCDSTHAQLSFYSRIKECNKLWDERVIIDAEQFLSQLLMVGSDTDELIDYNRRINEKFTAIQKQNRFMNEKKCYEVDTMSKFIANLCKILDVNTIVEIGSGRAYLSAQLSSKIFENKFNVIAIDSSESNVQSSLKRLNTMKKQTTIFKSREETEADTLSRFKTFSEFIQSTSELSVLLDTGSSDYALVGLHCCGNLSNSIVNLYLSNSQESRHAKLLCNVACCYNLMNEKYATDTGCDKDFKRTNVAISESSKFPMSKFLNQMKYALNFNVRMLACHSLDRCLKSLDDFKELNDLGLWYRCVLEVILLERFGDSFENLEALLNAQVGRRLVKSSSFEKVSFRVYVRTALSKLNLSNEKITDEEIDHFLEKNKQNKAKFTAFTQLKLIISPIIEYIILLDRFIYLSECNYERAHKYKNYLIRLFDPARSPRCYALVSYLE